MSAADFFAASNVLIVAGKGGVGKTTVGATLGLAAARAGLDTLIVELEGRSTLAAPFGAGELAYDDVELVGPPEVSGRLRGRKITPDEALVEYLANSGAGRAAGRVMKSSVIDLVATSAPGIRDLVTLGKIRSTEESGAFDLIIVDAPAAGHAVSFLRSPAGLAGSAASGPVREQADAALAMLSDPARCQVLLVTLPEETPVTELIETAYVLEDDVGVALAPVVVNGVWPPIAGLEEAVARRVGETVGPGGVEARDGVGAALRFRLTRQQSQQREIERLAMDLPLPRVELPYVFEGEIDRAALGRLATVISDGLEQLDQGTVDR